MVLKEIYFKSIKEILETIDAGELTVAELVQYCLGNIEKYQEELKAVISVNPNAKEEAEEIDRNWKQFRAGKKLPGIPILLKDNVEQAGTVTTAGSLSLRDFVAEQDAFIVKKLKMEGAIIIAKTNLHEFAIWGETISSIAGQAVNPYDTTRTPGGSSGGTGAGLAVMMGVAGIGTDTINSVRSPASANSLVGIRPSLGLVSRRGIVPYSLKQDTAGPITRCVADAALMLDVIAGYDREDALTELCRDKVIGDYEKHLLQDGLKNKKIAVMQSFFGKEKQHVEVNEIVWGAIEKLKEMGAAVEILNIPIDSQDLVREVCIHMYDFNADISAYLNKKGKAVRYGSLKEIYDSGEIGADVKENIEDALKLTKDCDEYRNRLQKQSALKEKMYRIFEDNHFDVIVYPHQQQLVCKIGEKQNGRNGSLGSSTGFPSIVVPAGFSEPTVDAPIGVPVGLEFLAPPFEEGRLIEIAYCLEQNVPVRRMPQIFKNR